MIAYVRPVRQKEQLAQAAQWRNSRKRKNNWVDPECRKTCPFTLQGILKK